MPYHPLVSGLAYVGAGVATKAANKIIDAYYPSGVMDPQAHLGGGQGRRRREKLGWSRRQLAQGMEPAVAASVGHPSVREAEDALRRAEDWLNSTYTTSNATFDNERLYESTHRVHQARVNLAKAKAAAAEAPKAAAAPIAGRISRVSAELRRYARNHRRRMRAVRYAQRSSSDRFLENYFRRAREAKGYY